jgi:hypothetical protein
MNRFVGFDSAGARDGIACPRCGFVPWKGLQWMCGPDGCGGTFDTFETHAHCPHCAAHFMWTQCVSCHEVSPHAAWYQHATAN